MQTQFSDGKRNFSPTGVWALGLILPRPPGSMLWERSFPFLRMLRPAATLVGAYPSQFDLVWAEPQPGQHVIIDQNTQLPSGWEPLQEKGTVSGIEKTNPERETIETRPVLNHSALTINQRTARTILPSLYSTVFLLTERMRSSTPDRSRAIDFANAQAFSSSGRAGNLLVNLAQELSSQSANTDTRSMADVALQNQGVDELIGKQNPFEARKNLPGSTFKEPVEDLNPRINPVASPAPMLSLPHAAPQAVMLSTMIEATFQQKIDKLKDMQKNAEDDSISRQERINAGHPTSIFEAGSFRPILDDEYLRKLMARLQELAREDRFRMGLGF